MLGAPGNQMDTPFTCLSKCLHKPSVRGSVLGAEGYMSEQDRPAAALSLLTIQRERLSSSQMGSTERNY